MSLLVEKGDGEEDLGGKEQVGHSIHMLTLVTVL